MSRFLKRCLLFCAAFIGASAWQPAALGMTVEPDWNHDWTVQVGDYRFGLEETDWGWVRSTTIYWGSGYVETSWHAWTIVATAAGALATVIAAAGLVFATFARRSERKDSAAGS